MDNLAHLYRKGGEYAKAESLVLETLELKRREYGDENSSTLYSLHCLASVYWNRKDYAKAEPLLVQCLAAYRRRLGPEHPRTVNVMMDLAGLYRDLGNYAKAEPLFLECRELVPRVVGKDHTLYGSFIGNLAGFYYEQGKFEQAIPLFEEALERTKANLGPDHPDTLNEMANLGGVYVEAGQLDRGILLLKDALERCRKQGPDSIRLGQVLAPLARAYDQARLFAEARPLHQERVAYAQKRFGPDDVRTATALAEFGLHLLQNQQWTEAETPLRACVRIRTQQEPDAWRTFNARSMLGGALSGQQKYAEAEPLLLEGYQGMKAREGQIPPGLKVRLSEALERLVQLYDAWGKPEEAQAWRQKFQAAKTPADKGG
jgi:tetratricopeptide (TPR) repeat protein